MDQTIFHPIAFSYCILLMLLFLSNGTCLMAQNELDTTLYHPNIKQLKGVYDSSEGTYFYREIDARNMKITHQYVVDEFFNGNGIAEYTFSIEGERRNNDKFYGVIDTNGKILVPCLYDKLKHARNKDFFFFNTDDSIGVVNISGKEIIHFAARSTLVDVKDNARSYRSNNLVYQKWGSPDFCICRLNDQYGIFSFYKEKMVVPAQYDEVELFNNIAICLKNKFNTAYDCKKEKISEEFKQIIALDKGNNYYVQLMSGQKYVCKDILNPLQTINYHMNKDEVMEIYHKLLICQDKGKFGVLNEKGNEKIPFIYENIYFMHKNYFLVEKDHKWAILDTNNQLKSDFIFLDVNIQNQINLQNSVHFSGIDTIIYTSRDLYSERQLRDRSSLGLLLGIQDELKTIKTELQSHILSDYFQQSLEKQYILKTADGYKLIVFWEDNINGLRIDSLSWDNIFLTPKIYNYQHSIGLQKGNKYGYLFDNPEKKMKYDGIYFSHRSYYYDAPMFSGSHTYISPYLYVRKGVVYFEISPQKKAWWKVPFTPPNWGNYYQGKTRMKKKSKEVNFIKYRSEKMVPQMYKYF